MDPLKLNYFCLEAWRSISMKAFFWGEVWQTGYMSFSTSHLKIFSISLTTDLRWPGDLRQPIRTRQKWPQSLDLAASARVLLGCCPYYVNQCWLLLDTRGSADWQQQPPNMWLRQSGTVHSWVKLYVTKATWVIPKQNQQENNQTGPGTNCVWTN